LQLTAPLPPAQVMLLGLPSADALMQVFDLFRARVGLQAFEFFSDRALQHVLATGARRVLDGEHAYYVVVEFDAALETERQAGEEAFALAQEQGWVGDGVVAQSAAQAAALWRLREGITEALAPRRPYKTDVSVRIGALPEFMREVQDLLRAGFPQLEVVWFGHIGDGNLHINLLPPEDMGGAAFGQLRGEVTSLLAAALSRHGGSISAEHGIGLVKREYLSSSRSAAEIALMRGIRAVFDPNHILNPGKLFTAD